MATQILKNSPQNLQVSKFSIPHTYAELRSAVRSEISAGQERAFRAVEREKVVTAWRTGKIVLSHILLNKKRADYGAHVIEKLSGDIGISKSELNRMVDLGKTYPIGAPGRQLSWSHYKVLLAVEDPKTREALAQKAEAGGWTRERLREESRKTKSRNVPALDSRPGDKAEPPLAARLGKPGVRAIVDWEGKKAHDLGFTIYLEIKGPVPEQTPPAVEDLYTYEARVQNVIDGDTLWTKINLGFGVWAYQKLRLRGIDTPEMISREGVQARDFLKAQLEGECEVLIKTVKADKYDRYLADVFYKRKGSRSFVYLNQLLLDKQLARRV